MYVNPTPMDAYVRHRGDEVRAEVRDIRIARALREQRRTGTRQWAARLTSRLLRKP